MENKSKYLNETFIGRWVNNTLSLEENSRFNTWIKENHEFSEEFETYLNIWKKTSEIKLETGESSERRWNVLKHRISATNTKKHNIISMRNIRNFSFLAVAATLFFTVYLWNVLDKQINIYAPQGELVVHQLPDGSMIFLNADSKIKYNADTYSENRVVKLKGEALFEVKPGKSFIVKTGLISTKVLGTSFNVKTWNNQVEVACISGKVQVQSEKAPNSAVILTPGLLCKTSDENIPEKTEPFIIKQKTDWLNGNFYFSNTPLREVFSELERQFNVQLKYDSKIGGQTFS
ncbi:MAG: FecR domain-containing protein, partial [Calditrichia bacterium]|nr:FecR domain-containing protein [Calditrichia bacterium]